MTTNNDWITDLIDNMEGPEVRDAASEAYNIEDYQYSTQPSDQGSGWLEATDPGPQTRHIRIQVQAIAWAGRSGNRSARRGAADGVFRSGQPGSWWSLAGRRDISGSINLLHVFESNITIDDLTDRSWNLVLFNIGDIPRITFNDFVICSYGLYTIHGEILTTFNDLTFIAQEMNITTNPPTIGDNREFTSSSGGVLGIDEPWERE